MGPWKAGYATVSLDEVMKTKALLGVGPEGWTNCITEGFAMKTDKKSNIFTDSKYGFYVIRDACSCCHLEKREMLIDRYNPPQNIQIWFWLFYKQYSSWPGYQ